LVFKHPEAALIERFTFFNIPNQMPDFYVKYFKQGIHNMNVEIAKTYLFNLAVKG